MKVKIFLLISFLCMTSFSAMGQTPVTRNIPATSTTDTKVSYVNGVLTIGDVTYRMVYVEGGTFTMGATSEQGSDAESNEKPTHRVTLSSYSIGQTEVTQALWKAVMGNNPSEFKGYDHPVENVSWKDCQVFIRKLNKLTGQNFRLPTEAEWEYAARGGNKSQGYKYAGSNSIDSVAWYTNTTKDSGTKPVGTKKANELGLYDMSGNVWEWCKDRYGNYSIAHKINPKGPFYGRYRVVRGDAWGIEAWGCRVSNRNSARTWLKGGEGGLRLVLP